MQRAAPEAVSLHFVGQYLSYCMSLLLLLLCLGMCVSMSADKSLAIRLKCLPVRFARGGGVRTCPLTGRGSCRAEAQTAARGRSCGEPSWCYAVAGGD